MAPPPLRHLKAVEMQRRDIKPPLGAEPLEGRASVEVRAAPEDTGRAHHNRGVDDRRPPDESHGTAKTSKVTDEQVVGRHAKGRALGCCLSEVDRFDIGPQDVCDRRGVSVVHLEHGREVEVEVMGQELLGVDACEVGITVRLQVLIDEPVDLDPAAGVANLVAALRDRQLAASLVDVPQVDRLGDDRDAAGLGVGLHREELILVENPLREGHPAVDKPLVSVDLVDAHGVGDEIRTL
ncbi:unannotated protein [freshwater metagenome]|uniref:Unannotated protein n=1 Tax=freshwater metagenome TaxID=449393 RepID=A0A6J7E6M3_9ZZZZ